MDARVAPYSDSPKDSSDPRLTPVGRIVRLAGLDELPQLYNVLKGEMSLVGPRPEMPHIVAGYNEAERTRLRARPGLTGIWQLSPDRSQAIHENLEYDLYYMSRDSIIIDLLVLGETFVFFARALGSSIVERTRALDPADAAKILDPRSLPSRLLGAQRKDASQYIFVALDQRRRPDEPPSWSAYLPRFSRLESGYAVKLLAAPANQSRFAELTPSKDLSEDGSRLEFVPYESEYVHELARNADCVVTDLSHIAEWAFGAGVPTFLLRHDEDDLEIGPNSGDEGITAVVRSALGGTSPISPVMA
jgi:hypothetical protein